MFCARSKVKRWAHEDIFAAAQYGLLMAAERTNTTEREGFRRFACSRIRGAISDWSRNLYHERRLQRLRLKYPGRTILMVGVTMPGPRNNLYRFEGDEEEYLPAKDNGMAKAVDDRDEIAAARRGLPKKLLAVFDELVAGRSVAAIAAKMHLSETRIFQIVKAIRRAVR